MTVICQFEPLRKRSVSLSTIVPKGKMIAPTQKIESWQIQASFRKATTDASFHVGTALLARCLSGCVSVVFSRTNHVRHPQTEGPTLKACTREMCFIVVLFFRHTTHGTRKLIANT